MQRFVAGSALRRLGLFGGTAARSFAVWPRKAKSWKEKGYPVLPFWQEVHTKDPHEYKLRSKEEIKKEFEEFPPELTIEISQVLYPDGRFHKAEMNRKISIRADMKEMRLTKKQRARLVTILGSRYNGGDTVILNCEMYETPEQNIAKGLEQLEELFLEAKRAP
eukprot:TRINITY_DN5007_c0_g1_i4.p1 TRINITY_DN5007_c0_g1~~TRINITY_DN5007_c0_g1_i4.p1  ORF type:complete len:164 (-),score=39.37 TRINITY_DN5007_c0_g1_i4:107-598(-)